MVLKILQISQDNTPTGAFLSKSCILRTCKFIKKNILTQVLFCKFCRNLFCRASANGYFLKTETSWVTTRSGVCRKIWFFFYIEKLVLSQHCFIYSNNISARHIPFQLCSSVFILKFHVFLRLGSKYASGNKYKNYQKRLF